MEARLLSDTGHKNDISYEVQKQKMEQDIKRAAEQPTESPSSTNPNTKSSVLGALGS